MSLLPRKTNVNLLVTIMHSHVDFKARLFNPHQALQKKRTNLGPVGSAQTPTTKRNIVKNKQSVGSEIPIMSARAPRKVLLGQHGPCISR